MQYITASAMSWTCTLCPIMDRLNIWVRRDNFLANVKRRHRMYYEYQQRSTSQQKIATVVM